MGVLPATSEATARDNAIDVSAFPPRVSIDLDEMRRYSFGDVSRSQTEIGHEVASRVFGGLA